MKALVDDANFASTTRPSYHLIPRPSRPEQSPQQSGVSVRGSRPGDLPPETRCCLTCLPGLSQFAGRRHQEWGLKETTCYREILDDRGRRLGREMFPSPEWVCLRDWGPDHQAALKLGDRGRWANPSLDFERFPQFCSRLVVQKQNKSHLEGILHSMLVTRKLKRILNDISNSLKKLHTREKQWIRLSMLGYKRQDTH